MLSRRTLLTGALAGIAAAFVPAAATSGRYRNVSGLRPGSFVWTPGVTAGGPVTVVVSLAERMVHVYRGAVEVGIATAVVPAADAGIDGAVLALDAAVTGPAGAESLVFRGADLTQPSLPEGAPAQSGAPLVLLPDDFTRLLATAAQAGAIAIVARERSEVAVFEGLGPFAPEVETGSVLGLTDVGRFAAPSIAAFPVEPRQPSALVVSRADGKAYELRDGVVRRDIAVVVEGKSEPLGRHALVLLATGAERRPAKWLAVGFGETGGAAPGAEEALARVRFADRAATGELVAGLAPGSAVILTDAPFSPGTGAPRARVAVLGGSAALATATTKDDAPAVVQAAPLPGQVARRAGNEVNRRPRPAARRGRSRGDADTAAREDAGWTERILRGH